MTNRAVVREALPKNLITHVPGADLKRGVVPEALLLPISCARKRSEARKRNRGSTGARRRKNTSKRKQANRSDRYSRRDSASCCTRVVGDCAQLPHTRRGIVDASLRRQSWERGIVVAKRIDVTYALAWPARLGARARVAFRFPPQPVNREPPITPYLS
uniref:Uncharacterized protein n=1 Tax=Oryza glumipatula TaxID=40148 RepID=A0A0E0BQJ3_9ORYZ